MKYRMFITVSLLSFFMLSCSTSRKTTSVTSPGATILKEGLIDCFEPRLSASGKPVWCEASAVLYDGTKVFLANDKEMPGERSSVFYWLFKDGFADSSVPATYLNNPYLKKGIKYEDFALTPDGKYVFLSTAFDRVKAGSTEWNGYNTIVAWKAGDESHPQVLSINGLDSTSISYREKISKTLGSDSFPNGMPYFKLEGLAVDDHNIYWGVREEGKKFDDFRYKVKIITVSYSIVNEKVQLGDDFSVVADIDFRALEPSLPEKMGLSSIEYDKYNKRFLLLTSYENGEKLGGYLWTADIAALKSGKMSLVRSKDGSILTFNHKAEDLAIINARKIIVIHDDDRVKTTIGNQTRAENQAAYSVVEF